jgi:hypothetical protein
MKKCAIAIALVLLAAAGVFAQVSVAGQTYYYKYVETVDPETGMRKKVDGEDMYITFTKNSCYTSNEKGVAKAYYVLNDALPIHAVIYQGEENNLFVFMYINYLATTDRIYSKNYFYFSKDYKRINYRCIRSKDDNIHIYERADPPKPQDNTPKAPDQLW